MTSSEEWRPVVGFEGLYDTSSRGRVYSHLRNMFLKPDDSAPYLRVTLFKSGVRRKFSIHKLMAISWFGDQPGLIVRHKNDQPRDNRIENLEWGTHAENTQDAVRNGGHRNVKKTHCPFDHEYTEENTVLFRGYQRRCRICSSRWAKETKARRREKGLAIDDPRHGSVNGYTSYGCKCEPCKNAMRKYESSRKRGKRRDAA